MLLTAGPRVAVVKVVQSLDGRVSLFGCGGQVGTQPLDLMDTENYVTSHNRRVPVDQATEPIASQEPDIGMCETHEPTGCGILQR
jgi:hypothetical protein